MKYWALYSGGKDSTSVVQWLMNNQMLAGIVVIDTGLATPDWMEFIEKQCRRWGVKPEVYKTPESYERLVLKYGFPGSPMHSLFMSYLKGRAIRQFKKQHPSEQLASGVRLYESKRRFKNVTEWGEWEGVKIWSPLYNWTTPQVWEFFNNSGHERSPAYQTLCISGDCLCGAMATPVERAAVKAFYPCIWKRIEQLERQVDTKWGMKGAIYDKAQLSFLCADCESPQ